jgi:hypothetical protein
MAFKARPECCGLFLPEDGLGLHAPQLDSISASGFRPHERPYLAAPHARSCAPHGDPICLRN